MDKSVLLEKRKSLLSFNKNSNEIYANQNLIGLDSFFSENELLTFIENPTITELVINKSKVIERVKTVINDATDQETLASSIKLFNLEDFEFTFNSSLEKVKENVVERLTKRLIGKIDDLLSVSLKSKIEYYDTSVWTLYLSYGILEGKLSYLNQEEILLRSPLINIEIEVVKGEASDIIIRKINDEPAANQILEMWLDSYLDKHTNINEALNKEMTNTREYFQYFSTLFPEIIIDQQLSIIKPKSRETLNKETTGLRLVRSFFVNEINPIGAKMLRDYDELLQQDYQFPTYESIFHHDLNHLVYEKDQVYQINNPMNLVQKLAVANAQNKNTLIYGPPGTGKSEVVANLIANLLVANKNVIVISEKKAALDVLDTRLQSLSCLAMSAFDEKNGNVFYQKILDLNHLIVSNNKVNPTLNSDVYLRLLQYQKLLNDLINYTDVNQLNFYEMLCRYDSIGLSQYDRNLETIRFIYNKLKLDKIQYADLIKQINIFKEIQTYYQNVTKLEVNSNAYNYTRVKEFLNKFDAVKEADQAFVIKKFLTDDVILDKKPLLAFWDKADRDLNVAQILECMHKTIDTKTTYIVNAKKIFATLNSTSNLIDFISLYDWLSNTKIQTFIELLNNGNTAQNVIKSYWDYQIQNAKHTDQIIRDYYISNLKQKLLSNHADEVKWVELVRKANLTKKPNVNRAIKEYYQILRNIFPIWILSPDAAASIIPLKAAEFDYGIFDEASQMRLERSIPLIYRCRFAVVSGDDKQLKPTSFFSKGVTLDATYEGHLDNVDSLLDKAKASNWMSFTLSNHYRAISEQLIWFSSHYFYDDQLFCISRNGEFRKAIEVYEEPGVYNRTDNINEVEATRVIEILKTMNEVNQSVLVITFNLKQADYILQLAQNHRVLSDHIDNLKIKIRSLENVQGDEADMVIISTTFGKDKDGRFLQNFGPVNQTGGKNRINVMVSRAKQKMIIVKSFKASDITNVDNENTTILKNFLNYVEQLQIDTSIQKQSELDVSHYLTNEASQAIDEIIKELKFDQGLVIEKNKNIGTHVMDIAVSKANNSKIALCVLMDDQHNIERNMQDIKQWIVNVDRQRYYEDRGYHTYRFNLAEWNTNHQAVIKRIRAEIV